MIIVALWIISLIPLLLLPYSIALFYQRSFKRNTYPYFFLISLALYIVSSLAYVYPAFSAGNLFFALAGVILGGASIRLYHVMTKRWQ
jgi:hypothetical protein